MRKCIFIIIFFMLLNFSFASAEQQIDENTWKIIEDIKAKSEKIISYVADVTMVLKKENLEEVYKGKRISKRPDIKTEFFVDNKLFFLLIIRNKEIWQYFPSDKVVFYINRKVIEDKFGSAPAFLLSQKDRLIGEGIFENVGRLKYTGMDEVDGKKVYVLRGETINKEQLLGLGRTGEEFYAKDIVLWIGSGDGVLYKRIRDDKFSKIKLTETYNNFLINIPIEDREFEFVMPKGANFIDRTDEIEKSFLIKNKLSEEEQQAQNYINQAMEYAKNNQLEKTIEILKEAIKLFPNVAELYYKLGTVYCQKHLYNEAIEELKKAIAIQPYDPEAYYNLGLSYCGIGLFDKAIAELNKALEINPDDDWIHGNLAVVYEKKGEIEEAKKELKISIELFREQGKEDLAKSTESYLEKLETLSRQNKF